MKFGEKIRNFFLRNASINDDLFDDLCDLLVEGDFGAAEAYKTAEHLKEQCRKEGKSDINLNEKLCSLLIGELRKAKPVKYPLAAPLSVILLLGVNGTGKTTTAAKLSYLFSTRYNKKSILAAADTFRAAAIDQLKIHGEKLNTRVVAHRKGGDSAAVVYDALDAAISTGADAVIADTAGRMHTKTALVEELRKIDRIVGQKTSASPDGICYLKYLVLDSTTGRNAFTQAETFHEAVNLDGVILTKCDSTAKGGIVFSLASSLNLPVAYLCSGEKYTDIKEFDICEFAKEFAGIE